MQSSFSSLSSSSSSSRECLSAPTSPVAGKAVRFHPAVMCAEVQPMYDILVDGVEHLIDLEDACDMLWYNEDEYAEFADDARSDREFVEKMQERSFAAQDATSSVVQEQAYIRSLLASSVSSLELHASISSISSQGSDVSIAEVYSQNCRKSREAALLTGLRDAKWVQDEERRQNTRQRRPARRSRSTASGQSSEYRQRRERFLRANKSTHGPRRSKATVPSSSASAAVAVAAAAYNRTNGECRIRCKRN